MVESNMDIEYMDKLSTSFSVVVVVVAAAAAASAAGVVVVVVVVVVVLQVRQWRSPAEAEVSRRLAMAYVSIASCASSSQQSIDPATHPSKYHRVSSITGVNYPSSSI